MKFIKDDRADAYGYAAILICIVFCSVLWITLSVPVNHMTEDVNQAVADGDVSEQTAKAYDWSNRVWAWLLPVGILGMVVAWAFTRSNLREGEL